VKTSILALFMHHDSCFTVN